ncbi:MAG TPA: RNA polymerase sigma factor [Thermoanaerobaculia bacterium]
MALMVPAPQRKAGRRRSPAGTRDRGRSSGGILAKLRRLSDELLKDPARLLYERHYRDVVKYFRRLGFSQDEARELAQDVFVRVCKGMKGYKAKAEWSFLATTARHTAINEFRRRHAQMREGKEVSLEGTPSVAESLNSPSSTPEDDLIEQEERQRRSEWLQQAIIELPGNIRRCLQHWLGGLKYREIQEVEGISMDAVKARLNEARNLLRARLGEEPEGLDWPAVTPEADRDQES